MSPGQWLPQAWARSGPLWQRLQDARRDVRALFGIPDYERYTAHMRRHHPGQAVLTERDFHAQAIDRRYGANRPRCC
jgi:uncharacterized short protein YbdD (DUF466 family)